MNRILGIVMVGAVVLGTIWAYQKFSGKSIADLGK